MLTRRIVILHHLAPSGEHWDLMIEEADVLLTWQLAAEPISRNSCPIDAVRINDHRKTYLDYQGPISGGRGMVTRIDTGRCAILSFGDDTVNLELATHRLIGQFQLKRPDPTSQSRWIFEAT